MRLTWGGGALHAKYPIPEPDEPPPGEIWNLDQFQNFLRTPVKTNVLPNESRTGWWHTAFSQTLGFLLFQMETNISPPPRPPAPVTSFLLCVSVSLTLQIPHVREFAFLCLAYFT